jgi:hypothetical protein
MEDFTQFVACVRDSAWEGLRKSNAYSYQIDTEFISRKEHRMVK